MAAAAEAAAKEEESESDSDEEPVDGHKFGEPLTRTVAQDGFADRGGYGSFQDRDDDDEVSLV
jgi:SIT4-associating protein SAP185/190